MIICTIRPLAAGWSVDARIHAFVFMIETFLLVACWPIRMSLCQQYPRFESLSQQEWHQVWFSTDVAHPLQRCVVQRCSSAFLSYNEWFFELSVNFPSARSSLAIWPLPSGTAHWIFFFFCWRVGKSQSEIIRPAHPAPTCRVQRTLKSPFFLILMDLITSTWLNSPSCDMCTY